MQFSMEIPLDSDGFFRRECPTCEGEFKRRNSDDDGTIELEQYFCPLCGKVAGEDQWWTPAQVEHMDVLLAPQVANLMDDMLGDAFKGNKYIKFEMTSDAEDAVPPPALHEPDDMVIVEPPCHPEEPIKVPEESAGPFHCIVCGSAFAA